MNRTNKTIGWCDWSWNPIVGCKHGCFYCYGRRMAKRFPKNFPNGFEPTFYPKRLDELKKLKKPAKIFVCSVADLFADWTPEEWRYKVLDEIEKPEYNHLIFQLLTKNPENIREKAKDNIWVGATITCQDEIVNMYNLAINYKGKRFLSFEPLLERVVFPNFTRIDWVIIGKLTGSRKVKLEKEWVDSLIKECRYYNFPIFIKDNLKWEEKIQEYPKYLTYFL